MENIVTVQCVYGDNHRQHILSNLLPSLQFATTSSVHLYLMNYDPNSTRLIGDESIRNVLVTEIANEGRVHTGFAENHNAIFRSSDPRKYFIIINPDCIATPGCIDRLIQRKESEREEVGIVEGRQWPFEHPKEYDPDTLETPWASGAFCLIDSKFYRNIGGMDERYRLYLEDVDLSWQAWVNGYRVIYEPESVVIHFTGFPFYRSDIRYYEHYLPLRNFIYISRKFLGDDGEDEAIAYLREAIGQKHTREIIKSYQNMACMSDRRELQELAIRHRMIKILGLNVFHEVHK